MSVEGRGLSSIALRVCRRSIFVVLLSLLGGTITGIAAGRFIFGATFGTVIFCSVLIGILPFRRNISEAAIDTPGTYIFVLLLISAILAVVYVLSLVVMQNLDSKGFEFVSNPQHPYIIAPACFYVLVLIVMSILSMMSKPK